jgi:hypothetical protein
VFGLAARRGPLALAALLGIEDRVAEHLGDQATVALDEARERQSDSGRAAHGLDPLAAAAEAARVAGRAFRVSTSGRQGSGGSAWAGKVREEGGAA